MYNQDLRRGGFTNPERNYDDEPEKDLAMAVCSLVFGIVGILTGIFGLGFDIAALVMGIVVIRRWYYGRGFAIAGIITSAIGIISTIVLTILVFNAAGDLKDDLISTITDYLYYYTDGGMYDDYDDEEYYDDEEFYDEEDFDEDMSLDEEYTDEEYPEDIEDSEDLYMEEDISNDGGLDNADDGYYDESSDIDTIDAETVEGSEALNRLFSDETGYEEVEVYDGSEDTDTEE